MRKRSRSIVKGAIAGLLGGIVATAAKSAAEKIYPPHAYGAPGSELPSIPLRRPRQTFTGDQAKAGCARDSSLGLRCRRGGSLRRFG
jgi:hypothetical protein